MRAITILMIQTGRRVTFEYSLVGGVNDQPVHAQELASMIKRLSHAM